MTGSRGRSPSAHEPDVAAIPAARAGTREPGSNPSLRRTVARGIRWKLFSQITMQATSVATGILLARLLSPTDFGLAGMAIVFTGLGAVFSNLALGAALVQRPTISEEDRSTAFWTNVAAGASLTLLGVAISPLVGDFFRRPIVGPLFAASSAIFFLWSLATTQEALLAREMNFRSLEIRSAVAAVAGALVAVGLAFGGAGAWALVAQPLVVAGMSAALLWRLSPWRPRRIYSRQSLEMLGSFGTRTMGSQILGYMHLNMDNLLVGRFLGSAPLGVYSVAYNVMFLPVGRIAEPIQQVFFAALAKLQNEPARLVDAWARGNKLVSAVNVPAFLGMAVVAPDFVPVILGHKWHAAIVVLQLLSLAGVATTLQTLNWSAVQATGRAEVMLRLRLFSTPLVVIAFAVGLRWGVVGVAGLFAAARFIIVPISLVVTCRTLGCSVGQSAKGELLVLALAVAMAAAVYVSRLALVAGGVPAPVRLAALTLLGAAVYLALVAWRSPALLVELRPIVRRG